MKKNAGELGPAGKLWTARTARTARTTRATRATRATRNLTAALERLRIDRQPEEALTHGADPLPLALVFGIDAKTAIRHADSARVLLEQTAEHSPSPCAKELGLD